MGDDDDGLAVVLRHAEQELEHHDAGLGVKRSRRLVTQQDLRILGKRAGDGDTLLLTSGKLRGEVVQEWIGVRLSGNAAISIWLLKAVKCLDYILTPLAGGAIVAQMKLRNRLFKVMMALFGFNAVFQIIACFNDWMIVVDDNHRYTHGTLYGVYIAVYLAIIVLTAIEFLMFSLSYRKRNRTALISVFVLLLAGIVLQESFGGEYRTAYIAMTFGVALMFINYAEYYNGC